MKPFAAEVADRIGENATNRTLTEAAHAFMEASTVPKYSYNFSWLGRPIIQYPQDMIAMQELIWSIQPDLIIETGIAHGGSLIFYASLLELNAVCGGPPAAMVLGIDIDIRAHNRAAIEAHPMFRQISMVEGSSLAPEVVAQAVETARDRSQGHGLPRQQSHATTMCWRSSTPMRRWSRSAAIAWRSTRSSRISPTACIRTGRGDPATIPSRRFANS